VSKESAARIAIHGGLWLLAFLALAALLQRPIFAAALVLGLQGLLLAVSSAKQRVLREPLVFADLGLFSQAFRHPRLYLPYFGLQRCALVATVFAAVMAAGFVLEHANGVSPWIWAALLTLAIALLGLGTRAASGGLSLDAGKDAARFGLVATMWLYWLAERRSAPSAVAPFAYIRLREGETPPIVVVQSESFFDARRLFAAVSQEVFANFDALCGQAESGRLGVPVWGAYTMRTEFAFLSGVPPAELGIHRFNPYRRFARGGVATLASALRSRGYRTLCLHPYPASFFGRDRVFPALGFDAFLDAAEFARARRAGPYIADAEVAERIARLLRETQAPLFVFAITMENHGPLHLERVTAEDPRRLYRSPPPPGLDELTVYLRHLKNADAMIGALAGELERKGDGVLCVYGDHVPGMPGVYAVLGFDDPRTDYLIWRAGRPQPGRADRRVEELALRVLERAGLAAAPA
jgi:hypothetical protein